MTQPGDRRAVEYWRAPARRLAKLGEATLGGHRIEITAPTSKLGGTRSSTEWGADPISERLSAGIPKVSFSFDEAFGECKVEWRRGTFDV